MTEITDSFELSPQQEHLWLAEPEGPSERVQATLRLEGTLDPATLQDALSRSVARHEILRTTFTRRPGIRVPLQAVVPELASGWSIADLSELGADEQEAKLDTLRAAELARELDFASGPLVHALLVKLGEARHALVLTLTALVADAYSITVLARELVAQLGDDPVAVEDPLQYADFAAWQRELRTGDDDEALAAREFWSSVEELTAPTLPFGGSTSDHTASGHVPIRLGATMLARLAEIAARYGAGPASVVLAAWQALLGRSVGEDEVTIAFIGSERRHADLDGAIGAFARPVPIRAATSARTTFAELLGAAELATQQALVWQDYAPDAARLPAIGFVAADAVRTGGNALAGMVERVTLSGSGLGVWLTCLSGQDGLTLSLDYDAGYLDRVSAVRLGRRLERLLESSVSDANGAIGQLELLGDEEREQLLAWGDGGPGTSDPLVHARFAAHATVTPSRTAVVDEDAAITYGELERRTNQLAARLRRAGVGPGTSAGLCTNRSIDMVVGLLGIIKAGGAYIPLHYEHPQARLEHQLIAAGARAIVTQEPLLPHLPAFGGEVICLDRDRAALETEDDTATDPGVGADDLVYVIYTSGSTGTPKGVAVTHGNLANYAASIVGRLNAEAEPLSFGMVTSISTDLGNTSVFGALASGGTLVLVSPTAAADPGALARQLERTPLDVVKITPSHVAALIAGGDARVLPRKWLVIGGERATWDLVSKVSALSHCRILNHYGPTEATVGCCTHIIGEVPGPGGPATVPIGRPLGGNLARVLDEFGALVPVGAPGRLHIGGAGVARGYLGASELTRERFQPDPFAPGLEARMYDTGDLARWLPDGTLEFLGRVDEQVKIRGYRVEPAEVESALRKHEGVHDAVVLARRGKGEELRLLAYCTTASPIDPAALKAHLAGWLPEFMIPSAIVMLDSLPMTPSGKVDRLALPDPETAETGSGYVAPRSPLEQAVADIWADVLGVERVGVEDDFFALGGHSLLATQVVAQVRSDFAVDLPLHSLFMFPTVSSLSAEVVSIMGDSDEEETARLMAELEELTDEEAEALLAGELPPER